MLMPSPRAGRRMDCQDTSAPVIAVQAAVLYRLGQVLRRDLPGAAQVRDGARYLQNTVVSARGQAHAADGHFQSALARIVQSAEFADMLGGDLRVVVPALLLDGAGLRDTLPHVRRGGAAMRVRSSLNGTAGTSMCKSMRSSRGP